MNPCFVYDFSEGRYEIYSSSPPLPCIRPKQVHGNMVLEAQEIENETSEADGIVDFHKNKNLCIATADCLPVLFIGKKGNALVHAGWRGLQNKILWQKILGELLPHTIFLGPSICSQHYEVGEEFKDYFSDSSLKQSNQKYYFDLREQAKLQITRGHPGARIEISPLCTFEEPDLWSYRQGRGQTLGRNYHLFIPNTTEPAS